MAILKIKMLPRSILKGKVGIKFPASLTGEGGVVVTTVGRDVTIGFNQGVLNGVFEPRDNTLTALAALTTTPGLLTQTATDTFTKRSLIAPAAGITITNPAGIADDPTFALTNDLNAVEGLTGTGIARRTGSDAWSVGTTVSPAEGGTGQTSYTTGDILYASGASVLSKLAASTLGHALLSNGAGAAPSYQGFTQSGFGAQTRTWQDKLRDVVSVMDFGATGDGITDDTTALANAIAASVTANKTLYWPAGTYKVTVASLVVNSIGNRWIGDGIQNTKIKATGNFAQLLELQSASNEFYCSGISFDTTGTTTRCVKITRGQTPRFEDCQFTGNLNGTLVFTTGDICQFSHCVWDCDSANTYGLEFDEYNQNCSVDSNCRFGGVGKGIKISRSGVNPRVEGLKIADSFFINTGASNIEIGNSFMTSITGCVIDQGGSICITISTSADKVLIDGNWIGLSGAIGNCINFDPTAGTGHIISNNMFYGGERGISIGASVSARVADVTIQGNMFDNMAVDALELDSVNGCIVTGNIDRSNPTSGSWVTIGTHASKGSYTFANNRWSGNAQAAFDTASTYYWGREFGLRGRHNGSQAVGNGATSVVITHGLITTPSKLWIQPKYTTGIGTWFTNTYNNTQFTVTWSTATVDANMVLHWEAEV